MTASATVDGRRLVPTSVGLIHVRESTEGTRGPVVLLHQISSSSRMFLGLMHEMRLRGWATLAVDLPGFGHSDPPRGDPSVELYAEVVATVVERLGYEGPVPFLGHHTGARIAATVAAQQPTAVSQLALIGLPLYASETDRSHRWSAKKIRPIEPESTGRYLLQEWERLRELSPGSHPALIHREFVDTVSAEAYDQAYAMVRRHDLHDVVGRITCPTLIICPEGDPQARNQEYAAALIRHSHLVRIDGGVFVVDERAEAVADLACRFFVAGATSAVGPPLPS